MHARGEVGAHAVRSVGGRAVAKGVTAALRIAERLNGGERPMVQQRWGAAGLVKLAGHRYRRWAKR
eukprot:3480115-Pleurochrysis_carterae.AAC.1